MELEMEMVESVAEMAAEEADLAERLLAAAARLEAVAERMAAHEIAASAALEGKLAVAETELAQLKAGGSGGGRKTLAAGTMMAREGAPVESGALDAALNGLSVEQRIAVKAQMLRGGLLG